MFGKAPLASEEDIAIVYDNVEDLPTAEFYSKCVRLNKACVMRGLATKWAAIDKWAIDKGGKEYMKELLGDRKIAAFTDVTKDKKNPGISSRAHSFQMKFKKMMKYEDFTSL